MLKTVNNMPPVCILLDLVSTGHAAVSLCRCVASERALDAKRAIVQGLQQQLAACKTDLQEETERADLAHRHTLQQQDRQELSA